MAAAYGEHMIGLAQPGLKGHVGSVYLTAAARDERLAAFVGAGLQRGEQVVLLAGPHDHTWEGLLVRRGVDTGRATRDGSLAIADAPRFYPAEGQAALVDRMLATGRPGLRLAAQAEVALAYLGEAGYRRVEQEMDLLCATRPFMLLCQLQADTAAGVPQPYLADVIDAHPHVLHDACVTVVRDPHGVHLIGELDLNCRGLVEAVLQRTPRDAPGDDVPAKAIVVDLSQLEFMDGAGFRALLRGTEQWRGCGGTLVLTGARGVTRRVIEIVGGRSRGDVILR